MNPSALAKTIVAPLVIILVLAAGWWTRETWKGVFIPAKDAKTAEDGDADADGHDRVKLSEQAQKNIGLVVKEIRPTTYWRRIYLPGAVIDRPGHSDRGIPAPIAGVVTHVVAVPGKSVRVGDELFRLRLVSESFQSSQMELFKSSRELEIVQKERKRLEGVSTIAIPSSRLLELAYQHDRLKAVLHAHRQDLLTRQLTDEQIRGIEKGQFVTEVLIRMPDRVRKKPAEVSHPLSEGPVEYEVQELKVNLGDHVQAGQVLAYLSDHRHLYIEGKALKLEAQLLAQTAREGWPIEAEFAQGDDDTPAERLTGLTVEFLGNTMDANGVTLPVYIPFANPYREQVRQGKAHQVGQYRPGQKVLLKVAVGKLTDVFVVPIAALVREGPEAYVFRQNGRVFDRRAVHVLVEDSEVAVIANDGSVVSSNYLAMTGAAVLNRVLKSQGNAGGHSHEH